MSLTITAHKCVVPFYEDYPEQMKTAMLAATGLTTVKLVSSWVANVFRDPRVRAETQNDRTVKVFLKRRGEDDVEILTINVI